MSAGCVVASELRQLTPLLEPGAVDAVAAGLVAMGEVDGSSRGPPGPAGHAGPVRPRQAAAGDRGPAPRPDRPVVWARHRRRDHRVPDAAEPRSPRRRRSRHQHPVAPTTRHPTTTGTATRGPSTNAAATPSSRSAAALSASPHPPRHPQRRGRRQRHRQVRVPRAPRPGGVKATVLVTIGLDDLRTGPGPGSWSAASTPAPSSARRPSEAGLRRQRHPRHPAPPTGTSCTGDETSGTSPPPKPKPCGSATGTAPSPAAPPPPPGATPTTSGTGSTADPPT